MGRRRKKALQVSAMIIATLIVAFFIALIGFFFSREDIPKSMAKRVEKVIKPKLQPLLEDKLKDM